MVVAGVKFDKTITLGNVILMVGMAGSVVAFFTSTKISLAEHEIRLTRLERITDGLIQSDYTTSVNIGAIKQDVAVIRDRVERPSGGGGKVH